MTFGLAAIATACYGLITLRFVFLNRWRRDDPTSWAIAVAFFFTCTVVFGLVAGGLLPQRVA